MLAKPAINDNKIEQHMSAKPEQHLKVGEWWYLPLQDKLVKFDEQGDICETASLDNLCQKALNYFLVNAGRLITRDELLNDVWGVRDVSDGRISRVIRVLRVALGDDSREPRYIETIPKRGFRFIAPIASAGVLNESAEFAVDFATAESKQIVPNVSHQHQHQHWRLLASAFLCCVCTLAAWQYWQQLQTDALVPFGRFEPLSSMDGLELYPDVSKDGRYIIYSHSLDFDSNSALIIQDLQSLEKKQLKVSTTGALRGGIWSPDGSSVVYQLLHRNNLCEIRRLRLSTFDKTVLADELLTECGIKSMGARMSWSPDGKYIVYPDWRNGTDGIALMLLPLDGGVAEQLTMPPQTSLGDFAARYSPDGSKIAFLRDAAGSAGQIWLLDLVSRSSRLVYQPDENYPAHIAWTPDSSGIIFPSGPNTLSLIDLKSNAVSLVAHTDASPHDVFVGLDNRMFSSIGRFWQSSIRKVNNSLENPLQSIETIDFATRTEGLIELNPQPDGPAAVLSNRSGNQQVWLYYPDGRQKQISRFSGQMYPKVLEFSPDGGKLLVLVNATIWLLQPDLEPVAITSPEQFGREPTWGADSQTIYYKLSKNGRWQIMRKHLTQDNVEVFSDKLDFYLESPDAAYVLRSYIADDAFELVMRDSGEIVKLDTFPKLDFLSPRMVMRKKAIYYSSSNHKNDVKIYRFNLTTKTTESTGVEQKLLGRRFFVSLDEKYIFQDDGKKGDIDIAELILQH